MHNENELIYIGYYLKRISLLNDIKIHVFFQNKSAYCNCHLCPLMKIDL